jgi:hypothetical protein
VAAICYLAKACIELYCCCCFRKEESLTTPSGSQRKIKKDIKDKNLVEKSLNEDIETGPVEEHKSSSEASNPILKLSSESSDVENQMELVGSSQFDTDLTQA